MHCIYMAVIKKSVCVHVELGKGKITVQQPKYTIREMSSSYQL